jgi:hypothetical protein
VCPSASSPLTALLWECINLLLHYLCLVDAGHLLSTCCMLCNGYCRPAIQQSHIDLILIPNPSLLIEAEVNCNMALDSDHAPITASISLGTPYPTNQPSPTVMHTATRIFTTAKLNSAACK